MSRRSLLVLLAAFALSVVVRLPQLDRPLSAHHEYCTAFTLIALTNWHNDGFAAHHGMPSGGFVEEGKTFHPTDVFSPNERALAVYYYSHPPLAYDLPYVVFKALSVAPNALGLQVFNLFFHLLTCIALYHVLSAVVRDRSSPAPLFAAVLYAFMPAPLWFHGNAYMSDMFVQNFWVLHLVFALRLFQQGAAWTKPMLALFGLSLFLTVYTSWLGVFAAAASLVLAFVLFVKGKRALLFPVLLTTACAVLLALALTTWRYLQVVDAEALLAHFAQRFAVRGSFALPEGPWPHLHQLLINYRMGFLPVLLLLLVVLIGWSWRRSRPHVGAYDLKLFVALTGLPVLLDHSFLLQYAEHDFAALKAGPLLCGLGAIGLAQWRVRWATIGLIATCVAGVLYFYRINPLPGFDGGRYAEEQELGRFIAAHAANDEVVFAIDLSTEPQVTWYARRNVIGVRSMEDARTILEERGLQRAVVFQGAQSNWTVMRIDLSPAS